MGTIIIGVSGVQYCVNINGKHFLNLFQTAKGSETICVVNNLFQLYVTFELKVKIHFS